MSEKPRQLTDDEVRERFLRTVWALVGWVDQHTKEQPPHERLETLAHSILSLIDGRVGDMPRFILAASELSEDREHSTAKGENWFPEIEGYDMNLHDISGDLAAGLYDDRWRLDKR